MVVRRTIPYQRALTPCGTLHKKGINPTAQTKRINRTEPVIYEIERQWRKVHWKEQQQFKTWEMRTGLAKEVTWYLFYFILYFPLHTPIPLHQVLLGPADIRGNNHDNRIRSIKMQNQRLDRKSYNQIATCTRSPKVHAVLDVKKNRKMK